LLFLLAAFALVLASSILFTAVLRPAARPAVLISIYLLFYTNIVLAGEIANTLSSSITAGCFYSCT
jgi:hypothetical protein